jgi:hypothetical protein
MRALFCAVNDTFDRKERNKNREEKGEEMR